MSTEQDFNKFLEKFKKDIFDSFENELDKIVKPNMKDAVQKVIYDKYEPQGYERRKTKLGGLQHKDNIAPTYKRDKDIITANIRNKAKGVNDLKNEFLDEHLHDGTMFPEGHYKYKKLKRQLYDDPTNGMIRRIKNNEKLLTKQIDNKMKTKGWN